MFVFTKIVPKKSHKQNSLFADNTLDYGPASRSIFTEVCRRGRIFMSNAIILNLILVIFLALFYNLLKRISITNKLAEQLLIGLWFGLTAVIAMKVPLDMGNGVIYDGRSVIISIGAWFGGPVPAMVSAIIAAFYRALLGGAGVIAGILTIITSALVGLGYFHLLKKKKITLRPSTIYFFGLVVHIFMLGCQMTILPLFSGWEIIKQIWLPVLLFYPLATLGIGYLIGADHIIHQLEDELKIRTEKYWVMFEQSPLGVVITDLNGVIISVNERFAALMGAEKKHFPGKPFSSLLAEEFAGYEKGLFFPRNESNTVELMLVHPQGNRLWVEVHVNMIYPEGEDPHFMLQLLDIHHKKKMEYLLEEERLLFKQVIEAIPDALIILDENQRIRFATQGALELLEIPSPQENPQENFCNLLKGPLAGQLKEICELVRIGNSSVKKEIHFPPMGRWLEFRAFSLNRGSALIIRDITEQKEAEKAIDGERKRLKSIVEVTMAGTWEYNIQTGDVQINERYAGFLGYTPEELEPMTYEKWVSLVHPDDIEQAEEKLQGHLRGETEIYQSQYRMRTRNGEWKWVMDRGKVVGFDEDGHPQWMFGAHIDISEQKASELEIQRLNRLLSRVQETGSLGFIDWNLNRNKLVLSSEAKKIFQSDRTEYDPDYFFRTYFFQDDYSFVIQTLQHSISGMLLKEFEFRILRGDGSIRWVSSRIELQSDLEEKYNHLLMTVYDITHLKAQEELLAKNEERMRVIVEGTPHLFFYVQDEKGKLTYISPSVEKITGHTVSEWLNRTDWFVTENPINKEAKECTRRHLRGENVENPIFVEIWHKDNYPILLEVYETPVWRDGKVVGLQGVAHDITAKKIAEERLLRSESRLRGIMEAAQDAVILLDKQFRIQYWNPAAERIFGYSAEEMEQQPISALLMDHTLPEMFQESERKDFHLNHSRHLLEMTALHKDGKAFPAEISMSRVRTEIEEQFVMILRDISERKKLEEQLQQSQKMEAIGRLAGGIAHDFNNLLTVINGYSELALSKLKEGEKFFKELSHIHDAGMRAKRLTDQLLAFSRKQVTQSRLVNPSELLMKMEHMVRRIIGEDIHFEMDVGDDVSNIYIDPSQMEQVVMNLIVNSRDAMPDGGVIRIVGRKVHLAEKESEELMVPQGEYFSLSISDTGLGIPEENLDKIFDPFFTTKPRGKGTGLGLAIVYGIIRQNGGGIRVQSTVGEGTTFTIFLPLAKGQSYQGKEELPLPESKLEGEETVLLVEDDERVREFTRIVLQNSGYKVIEAGTGKEALQMLKKHKLDIQLVITDVIMPEMDGRRLYEEIHKVRSDLPLIFVSGYTDDRIEQKGITEDGFTLIQKPFDQNTLLSTVRAALDGTAGRSNTRKS